MEIETIKQKDDTGNNDLGDLQKYCNAKIKMIGVYDNGSQIASGPERENAFTYDPSIIRNLMLGKDPRTNRQKINRFYFRPSCCGLLCIDIDIKNGKDGLSGFYDFCKRNAKGKRQLPKELQDLPDSFPCYTTTANGGYHLYFKHIWTQKQQQDKGIHCLSIGVEVPYLLTAAGSFKDAKPYVLHGVISATMVLPKFIESAIFNTEIIKKKKKELETLLQKQKDKYRYKLKRKKDFKKPSWRIITKWTEENYPFEISVGKNNRATYLSIKAKKYKYTSNETISELLNDSSVNNLPEKEIKTIVKSIYKK